ncbi:MAG: FAD-dependent oxidoreductase [Pseudomonadota bacterium]
MRATYPPRRPVSHVRSEQVIVLGAGVAGLAAAKTMAEAGFAVTVIDANDYCGGAHRSFDINGYTFDAGSFFYEERSSLFRLAPDLTSLCPTLGRVQRRIVPDRVIRPYPMQPSEIRAWPWREKARAAIDLASAPLRFSRDGTLAGICLQRLGQSLFERTGLSAYIERFNRMPPETIDEQFFFDRMAFIDTQTRRAGLTKRVLKALRSGDKKQAQRKPLRVRPRSGHSALFSRIRAHLESLGVRFELGHRVTACTRNTNGFEVITDASTFTGDVLLSSIQIDQLHQMLFAEPSGVKSLDLLTLFVSASELCEDTGNVLYNFDTVGSWKRATIYSRIYPEPQADRAFFNVEFTVRPGDNMPVDDAFKDVSQHLEVLGLARGLRLEGHTLTPAAYPIYERGMGTTRAAALQRVTEAGVVPIGRQGRFVYLPTASGVINQVMEVMHEAGLAQTVQEPAGP